MNVAFEISPLIAASGTFGDKSGVYRYTYGLIKAYTKLIKKKNSKSNIVLFTFSPELLINPLNPEVINLLRSDNVYFLDQDIEKYRSKRVAKFLAHLYDIEQHPIYDIPIFKLLFKILFNFFQYKKMVLYMIHQFHFQHHCKFLAKEFHKYKIKAIFHSDTSFFNMEPFKNIITVYDLTAVNMNFFHRRATVDLQMRKMKFVRRDADIILAISKSTEKDLLAYSAKLANKKIKVIYPGLDECFTSTKRGTLQNYRDLKYFVKNKFYWDLDQNKYLLFYGTHEPRKNLIYLIKAFYQLDKENKIADDFRLILCGGKGWGEVKQQIEFFIDENYPIPERRKVIALDFLNDEYLVELIKHACAVVYPSLYEGFGLPIIESMGLGTPVITSNVSSMPEAGGEAVSYIDPHDFYSLKDSMEQIIHSKRLRSTLRRKSLKQVEKFSWNKSAEKLYQLLN